MTEITTEKPHGLYIADNVQIIVHLPEGQDLLYLDSPIRPKRPTNRNLFADTYILPEEYLT